MTHRWRKCLECDAVISYDGASRKYCSTACRRKRNAQQLAADREDRQWRKSLTTGTLGALSEMLACADLLRKGYHVFRAISPSCPCDIVVLFPETNIIVRVEVRTAHRTPQGVIVCGTKGKHDVIAKVLLEEGVIEYEPPLEGFEHE